MAELLTKTMRSCIKSMQTHGGTIERHPGGFWRCEPTGGFSFGTSTVEGLVRRGVAEYTQWQEGRNGRFPIKATLNGERSTAASDGGEK